MSAHELDAALAHYRERFLHEGTLVDRFLELLKSSPCPFLRTSFSPGHFTGSSWIVDSKRHCVLLTHHRKLNRWMQLGGHADGDKNLLNVARREAIEESGLSEVIAPSNEILDIDIHEIPARKQEPSHLHYDARYLFFADSSKGITCSDESHELRWVQFDQIETLTTDISVLRMRDKYSQLPTCARSDNY